MVCGDTDHGHGKILFNTVTVACACLAARQVFTGHFLINISFGLGGLHSSLLRSSSGGQAQTGGKEKKKVKKLQVKWSVGTRLTDGQAQTMDKELKL
jgi:hypothetical protein